MAEQAVLLCSGPNGEQREIPLDASSTTIGRDDQADVVLDSTYVSRLHARVERAGETFTVLDAGSRNGTFVNGTRIETGHPLTSGDEITIGDYHLVFVAPSAASIDSTMALPARQRGLRSHTDEASRDSGAAREERSTAILMFTDIADSTLLTEQLGDDAFRTRSRRLGDTLGRVVRACDGRPVDGILLGDGLLSVFSAARTAIDAAVRCAAAGQAEGLPLHLGLHAGDVILERGNVFGGAVNIAARVAALAEPGEVLVSSTVRDLARTSAGVTFVDRGERALKGVADPVHVWAVLETVSSQGSGGPG